MIEYLLGFVTATALFVFFPDLAVIPAGLIRKAWDWIKARSPKE